METNEIKLKPFQVPLAAQQTEVLRRERCFLNASGTGVGKTYLVVQTIKDLQMPTLVVCPKIAISQWKHVISGMGASQYIIGVTNPEQLAKPIYGMKDGKRKVVDSGCDYYRESEGWFVGGDKPSLLVFDELHRNCSGKDSKTGFAVARWCNKKRPDNKVLAMSATPGHDPIHMRVLSYLMGFNRYVESSFYDWCRANGCSFVDIGWGRNKRRIFKFTENKQRAGEIMQNIRHQIGDRMQAVKPSEVPGFPDEVKEVVLVDLEKRDHDALVKAYEEMPEHYKNMSSDDMVKILRAREIAEFCKAGVLAEMASKEVESGNSVFIAINFTATRERVAKALEASGIGFSQIYGGQKESERQEGIDAFQDNKVFVMIGMMQACSVALSLHDVKHERQRVSLISPSFTAADVVQALGRIRRVGGTTAVQKIVLVANSVEERVARSVGKKIDQIETLTDKDLMVK